MVGTGPSMLLVLGVSGLALGLALVLTPAMAWLCRQFGWVDAPDGVRKRHPGPVPRLGGLAVALAYAGAFCPALWLDRPGSGPVAHAIALLRELFPATVVVLAVGVLDDLRGLSPRQKLAGQAAAALLAFWAGVRVESWWGASLPPWASLPVTVLWLLLMTNAFNLIDGVDGLAAGLGVLACVTICLAGLLRENLALVVAVAPLAAALGGFLRYNIAPASIFLGDCGSLLVGFLLGAFAVIWTEKSAAALGLLIPAMVFAVPLADVAVAVLRRALTGRPVFQPDHEHLHHRLLERGLTPKKVVLALYGATAIGALLSLGASLLRGHSVTAILLAFLVLLYAGVRMAGYSEFESLGRLLGRGELQRWIYVEASLQRLEQRLANAPAAQRPELLAQAARELGIEESWKRWEGLLAGYRCGQGGEMAIRVAELAALAGLVRLATRYAPASTAKEPEVGSLLALAKFTGNPVRPETVSSVALRGEV